jgi:hypothetical protein
MASPNQTTPGRSGLPQSGQVGTGCVQGSFLEATILENVAVKLDQVIVAGALVKVVDVLSD